MCWKIPCGTKARRDDEAVSKTWISGRMGDFYVTSEARAGCELAYLRFLDGPAQAAAKCNAHLWARLGSAVAPCFTYGLKTEPGLGGATLMTHAKFEVIAKLIMRTLCIFLVRNGRHRNLVIGAKPRMTYALVIMVTVRIMIVETFSICYMMPHSTTDFYDYMMRS